MILAMSPSYFEYDFKTSERSSSEFLYLAENESIMLVVIGGNMVR